jgi:hypothetical protein
MAEKQESTLFRKKAMARISSPEDLTSYLRVTSPAVWLLLIAVILLLAGMLLWSSKVSIDSIAAGTARVENGSMILTFDDEQIAAAVKPGMTVRIGESEGRISSIGTLPSGGLFATGEIALSDGSYPASVLLRKTQVLKLLFN